MKKQGTVTYYREEKIVVCPQFTNLHNLQRRRQDLLRSWGTAIVLLPCSPTAAGPAASGLFRRSGTAPAASTAKAPAAIAFEAQSHGFGTGCLRFAVQVTRTPRKTRFRLLARLFRTGLVTRRVPTKGFKVYPTSHPPFPS